MPVCPVAVALAHERTNTLTTGAHRAADATRAARDRCAVRSVTITVTVDAAAPPDLAFARPPSHSTPESRHAAAARRGARGTTGSYAKYRIC